MHLYPCVLAVLKPRGVAQAAWCFSNRVALFGSCGVAQTAMSPKKAADAKKPAAKKGNDEPSAVVVHTGIEDTINATHLLQVSKDIDTIMGCDVFKNIISKARNTDVFA
jgi:hypothetical protein